MFNFEIAVAAATSLVGSTGGMYGETGEVDTGWVGTSHGGD